MSLNKLLSKVKTKLEEVLSKATPSAFSADYPRHILFFVVSNGIERAHIEIVTGESFEVSWAAGVEQLRAWRLRTQSFPIWLRVEAVTQIESLAWANLKTRMSRAKRNYFRFGLSLTPDFKTAMLEHELYANAVLYQTASSVVTPNEINLKNYSKRRFGHELSWPHSEDNLIWRFKTRAVFADKDGVYEIEHEGRNSGYRVVEDWGVETVTDIIYASTDYLANQVKPDGWYHYGWFPCFDRPIPTYNALRHASSTYALLEGWELTKDRRQKRAIDNALDCLTYQIIKKLELPDGSTAAFLVDVGDEIKLGGNAVCVLAYAKYTEITGETKYVELMEQLALGILFMQKPDSGEYVHILNYPDLSVKAENRIIYYDGEAAFALMRLYGITKDPRWLASVEKAFDYFIAAEHWKAHDHWLSYCVNELTLYNPDPKYYQFGLDNIRDHLDFVLTRLTTYPTLLELMMAAQRMIERMQNDPNVSYLLDGFDVQKFYEALAYRARYLLNGFFYPEIAMFFKNPARILGGFFIRHHTFRVRIDDVEHYLSGYVAYRKYLKAKEAIEQIKNDRVLSTYQLAKTTKGKWIIEPKEDWYADGICLSKPIFKPSYLLLAREVGGKGYLTDQMIVELAEKSAGIVCVDPSPYLNLGVPVLQVDNIREATLALGYAARRVFAGNVVGVTGSAGKTTTVAMMAHVLTQFGITGATQRSANLPIGIAWNQVNMPIDATNWVVEMAIGQMRLNAKLVRPQVAIVNNVGPAHLEYHVDTKTIAEKKSLIMQEMQPNDTLVLFGEVLHKDIFLLKAQSKGLAVITYGEKEGNDIQLLMIKEHTVVVRFFNETIEFAVGLEHKHMILNALAAFAALKALKLNWKDQLTIFKSFSALAGRGEVTQVNISGKKIKIYDESYNANPLSMKESIKSLSQINKKDNKFLILGDMKELGVNEKKYHKKLLDDILQSKPDKLILCGSLMRYLWLDILAEGQLESVKKQWYPSIVELMQDIDSWLNDNDHILLKASNSIGFSKLVNYLKLK